MRRLFPKLTWSILDFFCPITRLQLLGLRHRRYTTLSAWRGTTVCQVTMLWQLQWVQRACGSAWRLHTKHLTTLARPHHQGHLEGDVRHTAAAAFCLGAACSPTAVTFVAAAVKRSFSCNSNSLKRKEKQETKTRVKTQV